MYTTVIRFCGTAAPSLTESTKTRQVTTKGIRRPQSLGVQLRRDRIRKRQAEWYKDLVAKEAQLRDTVASSTNARDLVLAQLTDQIFSKGHKHLNSATNITFVPNGNPARPLVALAGRENVGKTSLLRSLFRSPSEVGKSNRQLRREAMNFFEVGNVFNIADLPGFGGTSVPWSTILQHAVLLRNFVRCQPSLKMLYYCMDVHYKNGIYVQDLDMLSFLSKEVPNFTIVLTKAEQINNNPKATNMFSLDDLKQELLFHDIHHPVLTTSAYRMGGIDTLRFDMTMNCLHALPTERLTYSEAKRLSERLLSQKELSTVRQFAIAPTKVDEEAREWAEEVAREERTLQLSSSETPSMAVPTLVKPSDKSTHPMVSSIMDTTSASADSSTAPDVEPIRRDDFAVSEEEVSMAASSSIQAPKDAITASEMDMTKLVHLDSSLHEAYKQVVKKTSNRGLLQFVQETSPWRNPLLWPSHVVPTKHPSSNIMRCPEDPHNPYLSQAYFVVPRADMCFRRPNVGARRSSNKGRYEADRPLSYLLRPYTVPYFPDIVDVSMSPRPWTFLGSREAYYERTGGRELGIRLTQHATEGLLNPLKDNPDSSSPELTKELRALEAKKYGAPIAMLTPPGYMSVRTEQPALDGQSQQAEDTHGLQPRSPDASNV